MAIEITSLPHPNSEAIKKQDKWGRQGIKNIIFITGRLDIGKCVLYLRGKQVYWQCSPEYYKSTVAEISATYQICTCFQYSPSSLAVKLNNVMSSRQCPVTYMVCHFQVKASKSCCAMFCLHLSNITRKSYAQVVQWQDISWLDFWLIAWKWIALGELLKSLRFCYLSIAYFNKTKSHSQLVLYTTCRMGQQSGTHFFCREKGQQMAGLNMPNFFSPTHGSLVGWNEWRDAMIVELLLHINKYQECEKEFNSPNIQLLLFY